MKSWWITVLLIFSLLAVKGFNLLGLPLYLDEGLYIFWAKLFSESSGFAYVSLQDGKTPLFIWLLSYLNNNIHNYLLTGRLISVFAGVMTAICWWVIIEKILDRQKANVFLFLILIAPYTFLIERMALVDSLLVGLGSLSLLFLFLGYRDISDRKAIWRIIVWNILSGIALGLAFMTKTSAKVFLVAQVIIVIYWLVGYLKNRDYKKGVFLTMGIFIVVASYFEIMGYMRIGAHRFWGQIFIKESQLTFTTSEILGRVSMLYTSRVNSIYITHFYLILQYMIVYLGFIFIAFLFGLLEIFKRKKELLWVCLYFAVISGGILLSAKVMASRYFYITVPSVIAISTVGLYALWQKYKFRKLLIVGLVIAALQSGLMVLNPLQAFFTHDDKSYFVTSDLSALGLFESINMIKGTDNIVGISGIWGVVEGSQTLFLEQNIDTVNLNHWLSKSDKTMVGECEKDQFEIDNLCWKDDIGGVKDSQRLNKYLFLTRGDENIDILSKLENITIVREFKRPGSTNRTYLLKLN